MVNQMDFAAGSGQEADIEAVWHAEHEQLSATTDDIIIAKYNQLTQRDAVMLEQVRARHRPFPARNTLIHFILQLRAPSWCYLFMRCHLDGVQVVGLITCTQCAITLQRDIDSVSPPPLPPSPPARYPHANSLRRLHASLPATTCTLTMTLFNTPTPDEGRDAKDGRRNQRS
jgi:hypothetical protein